MEMQRLLSEASGLSLSLKTPHYFNQGAPAHSNQLPLGEGHTFWRCQPLGLGIASKGALRYLGPRHVSSS